MVQNLEMQPEQVEDFSDSVSELEDESDIGMNAQLYRVQALNQIYASRNSSNNPLNSNRNNNSRSTAANNSSVPQSSQGPVVHGGHFNLAGPSSS